MKYYAEKKYHDWCCQILQWPMNENKQMSAYWHHRKIAPKHCISISKMLLTYFKSFGTTYVYLLAYISNHQLTTRPPFGKIHILHLYFPLDKYLYQDDKWCGSMVFHLVYLKETFSFGKKVCSVFHHANLYKPSSIR